MLWGRGGRPRDQGSALAGLWPQRLLGFPPRRATRKRNSFRTRMESGTKNRGAWRLGSGLRMGHKYHQGVVQLEDAPFRLRHRTAQVG